jgi:hypothetical protein
VEEDGEGCTVHRAIFCGVLFIFYRHIYPPFDMACTLLPTTTARQSSLFYLFRIRLFSLSIPSTCPNTGTPLSVRFVP